MRATLDVQLDATVYSLDVINSAAYRLISDASCNIQVHPGINLCRLSLKDPYADAEAIKARFLDFLTDERLREQLEGQTRQIRNLLVSLAFGALASQ
jgi:His-Xaa-Ser system protein HxsD